jgi:hypothetical protein
MAKIHFITQEITPSLFSTEKALRSLQHEVTVWTQSSPLTETTNYPFPLFTPFTTWTLVEMFTFTTKWVTAESCIFHLIASKSWGPKQMVMWSLLESLPQHRVYMTATDEALNERSASLEILLRTCPKMFFESLSSKQRAHEIFPKQKWQDWQVVPPLMDLYSKDLRKTDFVYSESISDRDVSESIQPSVSYPHRNAETAGPTEQRTLLLPCEGDVPFIFSNRKYFDFLRQFRTLFNLSSTKEISDFEDFSWRTYLKQNELVNYEICRDLDLNFQPNQHTEGLILYLAATPLSSQAMTRWIEWAVIQQIPVVMTYEQGTLFSALWKKGSNCFFVDDPMIYNRPRWTKEQIQSLPQQAPFPRDSVDIVLNQIANAMNRIY